MNIVILLLMIVLLPSAANAQADNLCRSKPEYTQFDFWVGEWEVFSDNEKIAESSIQLIVDDCIVFENYTQNDGFAGKSFNFYDANLREWRQAWVDKRGMVSEFHGTLKDGAMRFEGESHYSDGTKAMRRLTFFNLGPDRVRQYSEISKDDGKTWSPHYELIYIRKK